MNDKNLERALNNVLSEVADICYLSWFANKYGERFLKETCLIHRDEYIDWYLSLPDLDKYRDLTHKENENNRNLASLEKVYNEKQLEFDKQTKSFNETITYLKEDFAKNKLEDQKHIELLKAKNREYKKKVKKL